MRSALAFFFLAAPLASAGAGGFFTAAVAMWSGWTDGLAEGRTGRSGRDAGSRATFGAG